ncbi:MAG: excinuclease ABC subunit UvrA [Verrucomicrobiota bacterium]
MPKKSPSKKSARRGPARKKARAVTAPADAIEIRGCCQNNLKGIDVDVPLNELTVVTGPSGSGKSSFAFQTVYAEGQRRYVETFSPYTRQFFDRMDKPQVDEIRGIPPAIAIEQHNHVRTTRSTVGTLTEINEYLKQLFARLATGVCPECGKEVKPETVASIITQAEAQFDGEQVHVTFGVPVPEGTKPADFFQFLQSQGYLRILFFGEIFRVDDPEAFTRKSLPAVVRVIQDRVRIEPKKKASRTRLFEAVEAALHFGKGKIEILPAEAESGIETLKSSTAWHCADCDFDLRPPSPGMFSFNNALGACPECRGFGRTIGIDLQRALPDHSLSIRDGVVKAFQGDRGYEFQADLERCATENGISIDEPFENLSADEQDWIINGEAGEPDELWQDNRWYGVRGFFDWVESKSYKMHVRVFLSRYRSYTTCGACKGTRLKPESLNYRIEGKRLPDLWHMPISELSAFFDAASFGGKADDPTTQLVLNQVQSRLRYLHEVGLGYLDLDRPARTLSGGELQRVNLTTCLGASLVNTLFVLDEPSIGLHPRDTDRLIGVLEDLRDTGNTLLVVEHEESVIRAADSLIDIGPGRGAAGGELVYSGKPKASVSARKKSLTLQYLEREKVIPTPTKRRTPKRGQSLKIKRATANNLQKIDAEIPLGVFTCITGVSGSGKSTLIHEVLYKNLQRLRGETVEDEPGACREITGEDKVGQIVMVDQSPLSRTPRSTPVVYIGAFDLVRKLFTNTPEGKAQGLTMGYFSFNSGAGRCERCWGSGFEKVEMQFLSDIYLRCPECDGRRYTPEALKVKLAEKTIADVLDMTVAEAIAFFTMIESRMATQVVESLQVLADVGLDYLLLGQPLNTLSGGESQRLKLVNHLLQGRPLGKRKSKAGGQKSAKKTDLLIFDEPTTGLHFDDIRLLLQVFHRLADEGQSLVVIEHNIDVIKNADWVIDLGPEAGKDGGLVVAEGPPEKVSASVKSHTGRFLLDALAGEGRGESVSLSSAFDDTKLSKVEESSPVSYVSKRNRKRERDALATDSAISIHGAREHNLKDVELTIPRDQFVCVSGLSGSGKSTLAFDILFAEGQRRFLDSMSTYARQFVEQMEKPDVDAVLGLPPTVAIEQRVTRGGGKSTVGTVTEIFQFLRLLFAKAGTQYCPECGIPVEKQTLTAIVTAVRQEAKRGTVQLLAPLVKARKGFHTEVAEWAGRQGFDTLLVDGQFKPVEGFQKLERFVEHTIDVVVAKLGPKSTIAELTDAVEQALKIGKGTARLLDVKKSFRVLSSEQSCSGCGRAFEELDPRQFSFNSPHGWCKTCRGYGVVASGSGKRGSKMRLDVDRADSVAEAEMEEELRMSRADEAEFVTCEDCEGSRLNEVSRNVYIGEFAIEDLAGLSAVEAAGVLQDTGANSMRKVLEADEAKKVISRDILIEINQRLQFMDEVGLGYLQLDRSAKTLSGGESQRIRLASQLGSNLRGVLYVLDEPTIGLHPRDNKQLLDTLERLRDRGNSVLVVEHDDDTIQRSDHLIDLGPGAGRFGGEIVYEGRVNGTKPRKAEQSPTINALASPVKHPIKGERRKLPGKTAKSGWLRLKNATANNLKKVDAAIPVGRLSVITGISGSGKSTLMRGVLKPAVQARLKSSRAKIEHLKSIVGVDQFAAVYEVDQSPIGKTSRSCPATYTKLFDEIRKLFAQVPESRMRGFEASRFSFNTEGGRCETCKGNGQIKLEMNFLPTSYVECEDCRGLRYNDATLEVEWNGKNIGQVMAMSIDEASVFFESHPKLKRTLHLLRDTGLGYLQLGQPSPTLSGGEAQRLKLVTELTKGQGRAETARLRKNQIPKSNLYLIEEPTIGLHMKDVERLIDVLHRLVDEGHTVVVIEHNLDVMAEADYLLDIGPEAGESGGEIVAAGTPEEVAKVKASRTAPFLKSALV